MQIPNAARPSIQLTQVRMIPVELASKESLGALGAMCR